MYFQQLALFMRLTCKGGNHMKTYIPVMIAFFISSLIFVSCEGKKEKADPKSNIIPVHTIKSKSKIGAGIKTKSKTDFKIDTMSTTPDSLKVNSDSIFTIQPERKTDFRLIRRSLNLHKKPFVA